MAASSATPLQGRSGQVDDIHMRPFNIHSFDQLLNYLFFIHTHMDIHTYIHTYIHGFRDTVDINEVQINKQTNNQSIIHTYKHTYFTYSSNKVGVIAFNHKDLRMSIKTS